MKIFICKTAEQVADTANKIFREVVKTKPDALLGLATGSTPLGLYQKMAEDCRKGITTYKDIRTVNLDEYVGLDGTHEQSYRYFMNTNLFQKIDVQMSNTRVLSGVAPDLQKECEDYSAYLAGNPPDIQLLGIGGNGHIAFNEPGTPFDSRTHIVTLKENTIADNARFFSDISKVPRKALTMGIADIMSAKKIVLLATGKNKAQAVFDMCEKPISPDCPASALRNHPNVIVVIDSDAASKIL